MSPEQNKQVIERCYRAINEDKLELVDAAAAPDYVYHDPGLPNIHSWPEHRAQLSSLRKGLADLRFNIDEMIAEGDRVAVRWTMRGTHQGELLGVPATGKPIETRGHSMYQLVNGKVAAAYTVSDLLGLQRQLRPKKA